MKHGSNGYTNHHCRCDICKQGHRDRVKAQRLARTARLKEDPSLAQHGKPATYCNWGCRCEECRIAWAKDLREKRAARAAEA